jgi:hypothetical protein
MSSVAASHVISRRSPTLVSWIAACALAEGIGMTAAAAASQAAGEAGGDRLGLALGTIILGGLIDGSALGVLQGWWLAHRFPGLSRTSWLLVTVVVAGLGWAAASQAAGEASTGGEPPLVLIVLGALALGAVMGALLGAAQALVLRRVVRRPWRWVSISALGWAPAMAVIFSGATLPDASWSTPAVILLGSASGIVAGAILGAVTGWRIPEVDGPSWWGRPLSALLRSPLGRGLRRSLILLRVTGKVSGRMIELPVMYARDRATIIVYPGGAARKTWWRNLRQPAALKVWIDSRWSPAEGEVILGTDKGYAEAVEQYRRRWPRIRVPDGSLLVRVDLQEAVTAS